MAAQFAEEDYELDVLLPSASEAQPLMVEPKELFINIDEHGEYFVHGRIMIAPGSRGSVAAGRGE